MRGVCPFHRYVAVVMAREKRQRDTFPAQGSASGKAGEGALRRARPFHRRAAAIVDRRRDERPSFRARRRHIFERPVQTEPVVRALTKPANAKIVRKRRKIGGNFCFLRQLHLQPAFIYVRVSSPACKFASLACRLSHYSASLLTLSTLREGRSPLAFSSPPAAG